MRISVIIPALNEAHSLAGAVCSAAGAFEVIVSDGGSADGTAEAARGLGARVVGSKCGRGAQMDAGAAASKGDVLLFLHADTVLPSGWQGAVGRALSTPGTIAGAFTLGINGPGARLRLMEAAVGVRSRAGLVYGDQAIFVKREAFFSAGGFRLPLMEDVDFIKRLRKIGKVALLPERVATSARRWEARGFLMNTLRNWALLTLYCAGVPSERLYRLYYRRPPV